MRLLTYQSPNTQQSDWGVQIGDRVASAKALAPTLDDFIRLGQDGLQRLEKQIQTKTLTSIPLADVKIMAPIKNPSKVIAIGLNYHDHCRETGTPVPSQPVVFTKFPSSIIGTSEEIRWDTALTDSVDWEAELGVVISKSARHVSEADALNYVFGYTVLNDVTARDLQNKDGQWIRGKSLDTFCPIGPVIVTADQIADPQVLGIRSRVNGQTMQNSNTSEMIFKVRVLIAFLSRAFTLNAGDMIATGTPHGIGMARKPPILLHNGDVVEIEIDGIGILRNVCRS
jgi:2-keto-4-pentenoate hydratase/2-oxohepta-3-ene-1,7-dioic acid hydratase in catechol pathway